MVPSWAGLGGGRWLVLLEVCRLQVPERMWYLLVAYVDRVSGLIRAAGVRPRVAKVRADRQAALPLRRSSGSSSSTRTQLGSCTSSTPSLIWGSAQTLHTQFAQLTAELQTATVGDLSLAPPSPLPHPQQQEQQQMLLQPGAAALAAAQQFAHQSRPPPTAIFHGPPRPATLSTPVLIDLSTPYSDR